MRILGVSGPSCSGKSTLARHLRLVLPDAAILYEDDFYRPESELPIDSQGRPNWDCPQSFDLEAMRARIKEIRATNKLPDQNTREEENNNTHSYLISPAQIEELQKKGAQITEPVLLLDGILLFHKGSEITETADLKVLFPFTYAELKRRRESRGAYATTEGFWVDPPNFFDEVVWPEFVKYCDSLYDHDGTSYTRLSQEALDAGIWMPKTTEMYTMLNDVIDQLLKN